MRKVFCKEQLEKQTVVHGMETAHEGFSHSVWAGGLLAACWGSLGACWGLLGACWGSLGACWGLTSPGRVGVFPKKQPPRWLVWDEKAGILSWAGRLCGVLWDAS